MRQQLKLTLWAISVGFMAQAVAERVILDQSRQEEIATEQEINELIIEQSILEGLILNNAGIIVTPYYDQYGRAGVKVIPERGEPYYVDPHFDDPMQTNRHSDEANTDSNWRVFTWGE